ncbi:unnamed protein product [Durusdinium trenchii]|uniref:Uncharacterized protein n=1 Tax=Durusdinium trenchii TaxID=1381693 RepID=A0ABP0JEE7_9DINO
MGDLTFFRFVLPTWVRSTAWQEISPILMEFVSALPAIPHPSDAGELYGGVLPGKGDLGASNRPTLVLAGFFGGFKRAASMLRDIIFLDQQPSFTLLGDHERKCYGVCFALPMQHLCAAVTCISGANLHMH